MKKKMIGEVPGNVLGMMADLCHKLQHGARTPEELGAFLKGKNPFAIERVIVGWERFFKNYFNLKINLSHLKIPPKKEGFNRLIVVPKGFTPNQTFKICQKYFPCDKYGVDLDKETKGRNEREPTQTYGIWVCDRQEADEELKNTSAETIKERNIKTETILERELHELKYFDETDKHLDEDNITLLAGSRASDGDVPSACWYGGEFSVLWYDPLAARSDLRARAVVSF